MIDRYLNLVFLINLFGDKTIAHIFYKSSQLSARKSWRRTFSDRREYTKLLCPHNIGGSLFLRVSKM